MGRQKLPEDQLRSAKVLIAMKPVGLAAFDTECKKRDIARNDAIREAMADWMRKR